MSSCAALSGGEDHWWGSGSVSALVTSPAIGPVQLSATGAAIRNGRQGVIHNELMGEARASLRFGSRGAWFAFETAHLIADEAVPRSPTPVIGAWQQLGSALHLVNHHQTAQRLEHGHGGLELRFDLRVFQIEVVGVALRDEAAREGRLAHLARPHEHHAAAALKGSGDSRAEPGAVYGHSPILAP